MAKVSFGEGLLGTQKAVSTSRVGRLFDTGRSALDLVTTMLGGRDGGVNVAAMERLTRRLGELKGVGMKLGQILSFIDPSLPPETRALLSVLQRQAPTSEWAAVRQTLVDAFGARADVLLASLDPKPFAVASIGQVHRAQLAGYGELAVKVRHPGIVQALEADFSTALGGLGLANTLLLGAAKDARGLAEEARAAMMAECDFTQEAEHQRAFSRWLANDEALVVPEVVDVWSSDAVLTTRWEPGDSLEAFLAKSPTQAQRDAAGRALFRASVGGFHALGLLHSDPHPGNFAFHDGRVVLYDFGCVRRFSRQYTEAFAAMARALRADSRPALLEAARAFGFRLETSTPRCSSALPGASSRHCSRGGRRSSLPTAPWRRDRWWPTSARWRSWVCRRTCCSCCGCASGCTQCSPSSAHVSTGAPSKKKRRPAQPVEPLLQVAREFARDDTALDAQHVGRTGLQVFLDLITRGR
jgi:ABC1 atypical kinase-like domain